MMTLGILEILWEEMTMVQQQGSCSLIGWINSEGVDIDMGSDWMGNDRYKNSFTV